MELSAGGEVLVVSGKYKGSRGKVVKLTPSQVVLDLQSGNTVRVSKKAVTELQAGDIVRAFEKAAEAGAKYTHTQTHTYTHTHTHAHMHTCTHATHTHICVQKPRS